MSTAASSGGSLYVALMEGTSCRAVTCPVKVNGQDAEALLDTGGAVTLVHRDIIEPQEGVLGPSQPVSCVHGEVRDYPTTMLNLVTTQGQCELKAGVLPNLPVALLIG